MDGQDDGLAFSVNEMPDSTARILQSIMRFNDQSTNSDSSATTPLPPHQATGMVRGLFTVCFEKFFENNAWIGIDDVSARQEKDILDAACSVLDYALNGEIARVPAYLVHRFPEQASVAGLFQRARGLPSGTQADPKGKSKQPDEVELEEEMAIWLTARLLYCVATVRSVPSHQLASERLEKRISFVHRLESGLQLINRCLFCTSDKDLRNKQVERAKDIASIWITIEEDVRSIIEQSVDDIETIVSQRVLQPIRLLGVDRRTQTMLGQEPRQLEKRPFVLPLQSKMHALNLLLATLKVHLTSVHYSPHFTASFTSAIEALTSLWRCVMSSYPDSHDERMVVELIDVMALFFSPSKKSDLQTEERQQFRPTYLSRYANGLSVISLDKLCSALLGEVEALCVHADRQSEIQKFTSTQKLQKLILDTFDWLEFFHADAQTPQSDRTIIQAVIRYGELLVQLAVDNCPTIIDPSSLRNVCFALLKQPVAFRSALTGKCSFSVIQSSYKLLTTSLIVRFESSTLFKALKRTPAVASTVVETKKRKRVQAESDAEVVDDGVTSMDIDELTSVALERQLNRRANTSHQLLCERIIQSFEASGSVPSHLDCKAIGVFLMHHFERLTKTDLPRLEDNDITTVKSTLCKMKKELDLLSTLICASSSHHEPIQHTLENVGLFHHEATEFICPTCDVANVISQSLHTPENQKFHPDVFIGVVKLCERVNMFLKPGTHHPANDPLSKDYRQLESQKRSAIIRFATRILFHTDFRIPHDESYGLGFLNSTSGLGFGVMNSMEFGLRMENIAAGRLIAISLAKLLMTDNMVRVNRSSTVDTTSVLSKLERLGVLNNPRIQDALIVTIVLAFGLTRTLEAEMLEYGTIQMQDSLSCQLCIMLVRQLCKPSAYLRGVVRNELVSMAQINSTTLYTMLSRYLPPISEAIVVDFKMNANGLSVLLELLSMSSEAFLTQTAMHTVPRLVSMGNTETLERLAKAMRETTANILSDHMVRILTNFCLLPDPHLTELAAKDLVKLLNNGETDMSKFTAQSLAQGCGPALYFNLLVEMGDPATEYPGEHLRWALSNAFRLANPEVGFAATVLEQEVEQELRNHMLAILTMMNERLQNLRRKYSIGHKVKAMHGLGHLIKIVNTGVNGFIPQITTSLQASLSIPPVRGPTLKAWDLFVQASSLEDLKASIGQITAALVGVWTELTPDELELTVKLLHRIVMNSKQLGEYVYDVADITALQIMTWKPNTNEASTSDVLQLLKDAQETFAHIKKKMPYLQKLRKLVDRINDENEVVVTQSLKELKQSLCLEAEQIRLLTSGDSFDPVVGSLLKALTGVAMRFSDFPDEIRSLIFECLGIIGALDPDRFEIPDDTPGFMTTCNFADYEDSVEFALHLIQDELTGAYTSASDAKHQNFLAYAIQELLRFCGFNSDLMSRSSKKNVSVDVRKRWNSIPQDVLDVISPLLNAKYKFSFTNANDLEVPIYRRTSSYNTWLQHWYIRLIPLIKKPNAAKVFTPLLGAVRNGAMVLAQNVLPHLVLHILIAEDIEEGENIRLEIVTILEDQVNRQSAYSPEGRQLVAETIFGLMDHCNRWLRDWNKRKATGAGNVGSKRTELVDKTEPAAIRMQSFVSNISPELMATAALHCKDHARALLNFEQRIWKLEESTGTTVVHIQTPARVRDSSIDEQLRQYYESVHQIYSEIDEPDGMEGISTRISAPSILHQIREHESTGRWTSAQSCWEVELQRQPDELRSHIGLLRCLKNLGHYDSLRTHIMGVLQHHPAWEGDLAPFTVESSLVSNDWKGLTRAIQSGSPDSPEIIFGKVIETMLTFDQTTIDRTMDEARIKIGNQILGSNRKDVYRRVYDSVVYLHILHEVPLIDGVCKTIHSYDALLPTQDRLFSGGTLMSTLESRIDAISPAFRHREQILRLRRAAFQLRHRGSPAVGQLWVQTAKIARKAKHFQTSYSAVLQASELKAPAAFLQRSKLLNLEDQPHKAIAELDVNLVHCTPKDASVGSLSDISTRDYAKASLQRVRWMKEVDRYSFNVIVSNFQKLTLENPNFSSPYFYFGRFYDDTATQLINISTRDSTPMNPLAPEHMYHCCKNFVESLAHGTKFIYQALPRMLTLYFSLGEHQDILLVLKSAERRKRGLEIRHEDYTRALETHQLGVAFLKLDGVMNNAVRRLPVFEWLTVLPQVVSRVMHKSTHVQALVHKILTHVLRSYPDQALWAMVSGVESSNASRSNRCTWVLNDAKDIQTTGSGTSQIDPGTLSRKFGQCRKLVRRLLHLCNYPVRDAKRLSLNEHFPALQQCTPCELIVPLQSSLIASLPPHDINFASHTPFPINLPCIAGFGDEIVIMASLQKPRKIFIRGSDGKNYPFLCKPKDDLRKDARLMEFNSMINKLLRKESESRKHIRTYAVVVLNEECGLLEWVPNTVPFRNILASLYATRGIAIWNPEIKRIGVEIKKAATADLKKKTFEKDLLPRLGDRHGENILFDSITGDTVHVDFNCLFDKGRTFEVSEKVPFRLTHNMVAGLGVSGVEGVFRKACEVTMGILRNNKDSLMSVLETFVHDPLVDWIPGGAQKKLDAPTEEYVAKEAKKCLDPIDRKLTGYQITSAPSGKTERQTSTENQVDSLINEARDHKNLAGMYIGWAPFL